MPRSAAKPMSESARVRLPPRGRAPSRGCQRPDADRRGPKTAPGSVSRSIRGRCLSWPLHRPRTSALLSATGTTHRNGGRPLLGYGRRLGRPPATDLDALARMFRTRAVRRTSTRSRVGGTTPSHINEMSAPRCRPDAGTFEFGIGLWWSSSRATTSAPGRIDPATYDTGEVVPGTRD